MLGQTNGWNGVPKIRSLHATAYGSDEQMKLSTIFFLLQSFASFFFFQNSRITGENMKTTAKPMDVLWFKDFPT